MESSIVETMKERIASATTTVLVKSYVRISVALSANRQSRTKKRRNDFEIRRPIALNKLNTTNGTN